jgi:predicted RNase H-like nuclease
VARDDIVDAVALLVCARRIRAGRARVFPSAPERDRRGLRMEIVA